jgi:cytoskeletal protein CcmA (bactofilin family)
MSDIKVRVGQQNAVKVISSISGSAGGRAVTAENVIGGIGSIRELHVSGISTFVGVSTFKNDVYIDGDLYINDDLSFDEFTARNGRVTGITTLFNLNVTGIATVANFEATVSRLNTLNVSGISTFVGVSTFKSDVYVDGDLYVSDDLVFDEFTARNGRITGITTLFNLNTTGIATITNLEASVTRLNTLNVSGISTFVGLTTFKSDVYVDGDLYVSDDLVFDEFTARNAIITGIATITGGLYYGPYYTYGMPYFNSSGLMVSTNSPQNGIDYTNYIMTTDNSNVPAWSNAIDGGTY